MIALAAGLLFACALAICGWAVLAADSIVGEREE